MKKQKSIVSAFALYEKDNTLYPYGTLTLNIYAQRKIAESHAEVFRGTKVVEVLIYPKTTIAQGLPNQKEVEKYLQETMDKDEQPEGFARGFIACLQYLDKSTDQPL